MKKNYTQLILVFLLLDLLGCGVPQIVTYSNRNYTCNEYISALEKLWKNSPEYRVKYSDIVKYVNALDGKKYFKGYKSHMGIDSLSHYQVEYKFFHDKKSKLIIPYWIIQASDSSMWYRISLFYPKNKNGTCTLALSYIKYRSDIFKFQSFESLKRNEREKISQKFDNDIITKLNKIIEDERGAK